VGQENQLFKVVYNSDLIIRDASEAATLCVFYDQVFLPYTEDTTCASFLPEIGSEKREKKDYQQIIKDWEVSYGTLFDEGVLARLPPSDTELVVLPGTESEEEYEVVETFEFYEIPVLPFEGRGDGYKFIFDSESLKHVIEGPWGELQEGDKIVRIDVLSGVVKVEKQW
jgi:hypothetical protein